jgi:hypothetical protein
MKCSERRKLIFRQSIRGGLGTFFLFVCLVKKLKSRLGFGVLGEGGEEEGEMGR